MPRDMAINQFVMKIAADDVDLDKNSKITYGLVALDDADQGFFEINNVTGTITLVKSIPVMVTSLLSTLDSNCYNRDGLE